MRNTAQDGDSREVQVVVEDICQYEMRTGSTNEHLELAALAEHTWVYEMMAARVMNPKFTSLDREDTIKAAALSFSVSCRKCNGTP